MLIRPALGMVVLLAALLPACQASSPGSRDASQAIIAQERRALEQWAKGNPLGYLEIAADDVTYFDDIGAHSRVNGIDVMRTYLTSLKGKIPPHRYEVSDPNVQLYGDIGILTLRYHAYGADTQPMSRWKATSVYRRVDDQWPIVHAHWSLVMDSVRAFAGDNPERAVVEPETRAALVRFDDTVHHYEVLAAPEA